MIVADKDTEIKIVLESDTKGADTTKQKLEDVGKSAKKMGKEMDNNTKKVGSSFAQAGKSVTKFAGTLKSTGKTGTYAIKNIGTSATATSKAFSPAVQNANKFGLAIGKIKGIGKSAFDGIKSSVDKSVTALKRLSHQTEIASKKLKGISETSGRIGDKLTTRITLPILAAGTASFKMASDYEESANKVEVAFKSSEGAVKNWAKGTLKAYGIAEGSALDYAALYGDMATGMGLSTGEAAKMSTSLVGLAGDLSSFKNMSLDRVKTALNGIFTGETEALKSLGIVMTETNLQEYALSAGITKSMKSMTQAEKVQLRYGYVLAMTKNAQGDFLRTQGGAANQTRIFTESMKQLGQSFGKLLLPEITPMIVKLNGLVQKFSELPDSQKKFIIRALAMAAAIGPLAKGFSLLTGGASSALKAVSFFSKFNLFSTFGAITKGFAAIKGIGVAGLFGKAGGAIAAFGGALLPIIATIAALVAAGYALYKNWDTVKAGGIAFANELRAKFAEFMPYAITLFKDLCSFLKLIAPGFMVAFGVTGRILKAFVMTAVAVIGNIIKVLSGVTTFIKGVFTGDWKMAWSGLQTVVSGQIGIIKSVVDGLIDVILAVPRAIDSVAKKIGIFSSGEVTTPKSNRTGRPKPIPKFAGGTNSAPGGLALVGEKGPELIHLPAGSAVKTAGETSKIMNTIPDAGKVISMYSRQVISQPVGTSKSNNSYVFAPQIHVTTKSDDPDEIASVTNEKLQAWWESMLDDEESVG